MPNQKKGKATPKSTPSKATPKASPKTRGKAVTPKKAESPKASQKPTTPQRGSRSSTPSKVVESPKSVQKKTATPTKVSPKPVGKPAKASPKGKASPKSNKTTPKKVASPKSRKVESEESSEDENTEFKVGDLIDAQWDDNLFYSAKVIKVNKLKSGNTYNVEFTQDKVIEKGLKRNQIQSYTNDSEEEVSHKHKASNDDQEYVEGEDLPLRYDDESVESDSTEQPRTKKAGRKPATKRKREAPVQVPSADKKRKLSESLAGLDEKQLVSLLKKACNSNVEILEAVQAQIPEPKPARAAPKKSAEKKAPTKNAPKNTATKNGKNVATKKAAAKKGTTTRSGNK
jgi:hypothetical protein